MGFLPGTEPINETTESVTKNLDAARAKLATLGPISQTAELVTPGAASAAAGDTNYWASVHALEGELRAWLQQYPAHNWLFILEKLHELRQRSQNWPGLTTALSTPHRARDVYQAIANVLDQERQREANPRRAAWWPDTAVSPTSVSAFPAAAHHLAALTEALARLSAAVTQATRAEANARFRPRCNGRQHWRSDRYLYAIHTAGQECPLHGRHADPSQRLRAYVGGNLADQEAVLTAMQNWESWQESVRILGAARARLVALEGDINDLHRRWCGSASPSPAKEQQPMD